MKNYPLLRLIIPFTLGMIGANLFVSYMSTPLLLILCCIVLALSFFLLKTLKPQDLTFGIAAMTFSFLVGMTLYTRKHHSMADSTPQDTTFCQGLLSELPTPKPHSWALNLQQDDGTHILLYIGKNGKVPENDSILYASLHIGDTILALTRHLEGTENGEGEFGAFRKHLFHHGICATAYATCGQWTFKPGRQHQSLTLFAKEIQTDLHHIYEDNGLNQEASTIVEAMTIGRKTDIPQKTRNAYEHAGVSHVLALSGFHVGIIVMFIQAFFLKNVLPLRWQRVSNPLIIVTLWCYAFMTGMPPSLIRATLMFTLLLLCQSIFRDNLSSHSCAIAFLVMLCINPFYLHDIGFQLSFLSVASISLFSQQIMAENPIRNGILHFLQSLLCITALCTLFTAPLVAYHFGRIPLLAIASNLILTPFVYLLMFTSILWWVFLWCVPVHSILTDLLNWTASTMNTIVETISSLPYATLKWHPDLLTTLLCYLVLLLLTYRIKNNPKKRNIHDT